MGRSLLVVLLLVPTAAALPLEFAAPARMTGSVTAVQMQEVAILASSFNLQVDFGSGSIEESETYRFLQDNPLAPRDDDVVMPWRDAGTPPPSFALDAKNGWAGLVILARDVTIQLSGDASLDEGCPADAMPSGLRLHVRATCSATGPRLVAKGNISLTARGITSLMWTGAAATCQSSCVRDTRSYEALSGPETEVHILPFVRISGASGNLVGTVDALVIGGLRPAALMVNGSLRLAAVSGDACEQIACQSAQDGPTLGIEGLVGLHQIRTANDRLSADLTGMPLALSVDGRATDPRVLLGPSTLVAGGLAVAVLVAALFTRHLRSTALDHPRRRAVYDFLCANPGTSLRALARATGMSESPIRHHLRILVLTGIVTSHRHGKRVRFFIGEPPPGWDAQARLQQPDLRRLLELLQTHGPCLEQAIIRKTAKWQWARSTTQRRLRALQHAGAAGFDAEKREWQPTGP